MPGFLSPYRGERYHFSQYREAGPPQGSKELFNHRHSSLRNVIERCFGVLKARFPILKLMPSYKFSTQKYIVIACCAIHNFIRMNANNDTIFEEFESVNIEVERDNAQEGATTTQDVVEVNIIQRQLRQMARVRDEIAERIWSTNQRR
jgi:hypothetical protein